jgi:ligand-binding SRPBCC domain-containing protein
MGLWTTWITGEEQHLLSEIWLPRPLSEIFPFFADANNLQRMTPPWVSFRILTKGPIRMQVGALIDYRIGVHGVPMRWRTRITAWEPPFRFVDEQLKGPYTFWRHEHRFLERDGGTVVIDDLRYATPGGPLVLKHLVQPDVQRIFDHRKEVLVALFGAKG